MALANNETIRTLVIVVRLALIVVGGSYNLAADPWIRARSSFRGGVDDAGVVFRLTPGLGNTWSETVLHNFIGVNGDGAYPASSLIFDNLGNLYGTTSVGGINGGGGGLGWGTAFELTPSGDGKWKERVLPAFTGGVDGGLPSAGFILDRAGNLYSTTSSGGTAAQGTGFEIKP